MRSLVYACAGVIIGSSGIACAPSTVSLPEISGEDETPEILPVTAKAVIGDAEIKLEVAQTPEQKAKDLMFRSELAGDRGMLFPVEPEQLVRFWMKNVQISLDMLFIEDGVIQRVVHSAPPCPDSKSFCPRFSSGGPVDQVIEVKGGLAQERGFDEGDLVEIVVVKEGA